MAQKSPINIKALSKKGVLDKARFFRLLSEQNNYVDTKTVQDFYMGLVRLLTQELRKNGVIRLPHIGVFALLKSRDRLAWSGKVRAMMHGVYLLQFYPNYAWRAYFKKLEGKTGREGALDPREKVLGQTLDEYTVGE